MTTSTSTPPGLRERKKARTREAIQEAALRLFRERGYSSTTVEQIAEAADVSERTFFRYFPSKAETVSYDPIEPLVAESFVGQPAELDPTAALRAAIREVYDTLPPERLAMERQRQLLVAQISGLQAITPSKIQALLTLFADAVARRTGRTPDDPAVRAWIGAMGGVVLASYLAWADDPTGSIIDHMDAGLRLLEDGLPL